MSDVRSYRQSLERSRTALLRDAVPRTFSMNGREWDLLPGVFSPAGSPSTGYSLRLLGLLGPERGRPTGSLLEIGSGTGIVAVSAALAGCSRVVAADVNADAVRNTAKNAARHGVQDRVRAVESDLFGSLDENERFDTVFWHSNYVLAPDDYEYRNMHERGYVDPGYRAHRRFLIEAPGRLTPGGCALLHFSTRGDLSRLAREADACGRRLSLVRSATGVEDGHELEHMLFEISVKPNRRARRRTGIGQRTVIGKAAPLAVLTGATLPAQGGPPRE